MIADKISMRGGRPYGRDHAGPDEDGEHENSGYEIKRGLEVERLGHPHRAANGSPLMPDKAWQVDQTHCHQNRMPKILGIRSFLLLRRPFVCYNRRFRASARREDPTFGQDNRN